MASVAHISGGFPGDRFRPAPIVGKADPDPPSPFRGHFREEGDRRGGLGLASGFLGAAGARKALVVERLRPADLRGKLDEAEDDGRKVILPPPHAEGPRPLMHRARPLAAGGPSVPLKEHSGKTGEAENAQPAFTPQVLAVQRG